MSLLLCFSGQIGSGKSSVSTAVATELGWRRTGFGDYLRYEVAKMGGDPNERQVLQDLGQKRVEEDPTGFCRDVLAFGGFRPGDVFVIDGIRHVQIFEMLAETSVPSEARLLFLGASETTRIQRVGSRQDIGDFGRASMHRVESELAITLPQRADGIVNANQPFKYVVSDCLSLVHKWYPR